MSENATKGTACSAGTIAGGREAVWVLLQAAGNRLAGVENMVDNAEATLRENGKYTEQNSRWCFAMRLAIREIRAAEANVRGLVELARGDIEAVRAVIEEDEAEARRGGYLTPKRAHYLRAQRWALDNLNA